MKIKTWAKLESSAILFFNKKKWPSFVRDDSPTNFDDSLFHQLIWISKQLQEFIKILLRNFLTWRTKTRSLHIYRYILVERGNFWHQDITQMLFFASWATYSSGPYCGHSKPRNFPAAHSGLLDWSGVVQASMWGSKITAAGQLCR